jgi:hypothetical protein
MTGLAARPGCDDGAVNRFARILPAAGAGALAALSALHLAWAAGSTWPMADGRALADVAAGSAEMPGRADCVVVGSGLAVAATLVAGVGGARRPVRLARAAIAAGFLVRGLAGLTGQTRRLVSWTPGAHFQRLDRRYYGPLCLLLSAAAASSARRR